MSSESNKISNGIPHVMYSPIINSFDLNALSNYSLNFAGDCNDKTGVVGPLAEKLGPLCPSKFLEHSLGNNVNISSQNYLTVPDMNSCLLTNSYGDQIMQCDGDKLSTASCSDDLLNDSSIFVSDSSYDDDEFLATMANILPSVHITSNRATESSISPKQAADSPQCIDCAEFDNFSFSSEPTSIPLEGKNDPPFQKSKEAWNLELGTIEIDKCHKSFDYKREINLLEEACSSGVNNNDINTRLEALKALITDSNEKLHHGFILNPYSMRAELFPEFYLPLTLYEKLLPHQRQGIAWLWQLHYYQSDMGGILADDMGLGKTIQVIVFLFGLFSMKRIRTALIIMPKGILQNWKREFSKWFPSMRVLVFHDSASIMNINQKGAYASLKLVQNRGGIILTTYGFARRYIAELNATARTTQATIPASHKSDVFTKWDYLILDEGHLIKNRKSLQFMAVRSLLANHRLLLTGTPVQNRLCELWTLYDILCNGRLLGSYITFRRSFEKAIEIAGGREATPHQIKIGERLAQKLRLRIAPFFLRREKSLLMMSETENNLSSMGSYRSKTCVQLGRLGKKQEIVVWIPLTDIQIKIYHAFLNSEQVKDILNQSKSPLVALIVLKKICDHPALLEKETGKIFDGHSPIDEDISTLRTATVSTRPTNDLLAVSSKCRVLRGLVDYLLADGHRILIFSQSVKMLDIIQKLLRDVRFARLDGTISDNRERQSIVDAFQLDSSYQVLLLTTGVGGVGLSLTAADSVILFDPSWNPAKDSQAVDRAYRMGQASSLVNVFRLVTTATVEDKIYRRQVFKGYSMNAATGGILSRRYFTPVELSDLFILRNPLDLTTANLLELAHAKDKLLEAPALDQFLEALMPFGALALTLHHWLYTGSKKTTFDSIEVEYDKIALNAIEELQPPPVPGVLTKAKPIFEKIMDYTTTLPNMTSFVDYSSKADFKNDFPHLITLPKIVDISYDPSLNFLRRLPPVSYRSAAVPYAGSSSSLLFNAKDNLARSSCPKSPLINGHLFPDLSYYYPPIIDPDTKTIAPFWSTFNRYEMQGQHFHALHHLLQPLPLSLWITNPPFTLTNSNLWDIFKLSSDPRVGFKILELAAKCQFI